MPILLSNVRSRQRLLQKSKFATTLVTDYQWQAFNAAFCLSFDHGESVIVT